jgi:YVTN family beta-propeller protein
MKPIAFLFTFLTALICLDGRAAETLKLTGTVPLPGVTGRFDHFAIDPEGQRLFVAALGNNTLEIINVFNKERVKSISGLRKPCGIVFIPAKNQIGVAAGDDGVFKVFSGEDYKLLATVSGLDDADNVRLEPKNKETVLVGYGDGALAIIDSKTWKKIGDIKLAGHPESFQLEDGGDDTYVNVPSAKQVAVVDREKARVKRTFPMQKFKSNFPMAVDETNNRLFIGCRTPSYLVVLDRGDGHEVANLETSGDTDDLFYDAKRQWVYISCGEGFIDVVSAHPDQPLKRIDRIPTRSGARTSFFSRDLDRFFLALPNRDGDSAEIRIYQPPQP